MCCERFVSALNRIKSKLRSRLSTKLSNWLLIIALNGPPVGAVDWLAILDIWKANSDRGRYGAAWTVDNSQLATELQSAYDSATA